MAHIRRIADEKGRSRFILERKLAEINQLNFSARRETASGQVRARDDRRDRININSDQRGLWEPATCVQKEARGPTTWVHYARRRRQHRAPIQHRSDNWARGVGSAKFASHLSRTQLAERFPHRIVARADAGPIL